MTSDPAIEIVIAVHDLTRPIRRAVMSVLDGSDGHARVIVVCHGLRPEDVREMVGLDPGDHVMYLEHSDGIPSPAGPFNAGLAASSAEFVAIMGSDDMLEEGAIREWARYVRAQKPDVALMPLKHQSGEVIAAPLRRWGRRRHLDPVRDRLFYRSAPLGLLRRTLVASLGVGLIPGMRTGEDLEMSARLWASDARIDLMSPAPAYVIGADASGRVSTGRTPVHMQLQPVKRLISGEWFASAPPSVRRSLAVKLMRIHVLDALRAHPEGADWNAEEIAYASEMIDWVSSAESGVLDVFSRADRLLLDSVRRAHDEQDVVTALRDRASSSRLSTLVTRNLIRSFGRESVLRRYFLYRVLR